MIETIISSPNLKNLNTAVRQARTERYQLLSMANNAWQKYQIFVDEDPRWSNPECSQIELENFRHQLDLMRVNAQLADLAATKAYHRLNSLENQLFSILED